MQSLCGRRRGRPDHLDHLATLPTRARAQHRGRAEPGPGDTGRPGSFGGRFWFGLGRDRGSRGRRRGVTCSAWFPRQHLYPGLQAQTRPLGNQPAGSPGTSTRDGAGGRGREVRAHAHSGLCVSDTRGWVWWPLGRVRPCISPGGRSGLSCADVCKEAACRPRGLWARRSRSYVPRSVTLAHAPGVWNPSPERVQFPAGEGRGRRAERSVGC